MEHKEVAELIDQFLLGRMKSQDLARLEYLRKTDPKIDLDVRESMKAFDVIKYLRYKQLRQKLHEIDTADSEKDKYFSNRHWVFVLILLTTSLLCFWVWGYHHYTPGSIAMRHFIHLSDSYAAFYEMNDEEVKNWNLAMKTFKEEKFEEAILLFQPFVENDHSEISFSAKWDILLAEFALNGDGIQWNRAMIHFQSQAPETFKTASVKLLRTIESPFYTFFVSGLSPKISALKPRIM